MKKKLPIDIGGLQDQLSNSAFFSREQRPPAPEVNIAPVEEGEDQKDDDTETSQRHDVTTDVMTSLFSNLPLSKWRAIIANTETYNPALRLTNDERYGVEDVVNELRRKYKVKTSMNEIARIGLLLLVMDFKKNKSKSVLYAIKTL